LYNFSRFLGSTSLESFTPISFNSCTLDSSTNIPVITSGPMIGPFGEQIYSSLPASSMPQINLSMLYLKFYFF